MVLLKKQNEDGTYFEFKKIIIDGYNIDEQPNLIAKKQFVNGKRKKIETTYTDCIISIDLDCFDGDILAEYLQNLKGGIYEYYSVNDKVMKKAEFITTLPSQSVNNCASNVLVNKFTALLEKSGDII